MSAVVAEAARVLADVCPHGHSAPWLCERCSDDDRAEAAELLDDADEHWADEL